MLHKFCFSVWISVIFMLVPVIKEQSGIRQQPYKVRCLPITVPDDMQSCQPLQQQLYYTTQLSDILVLVHFLSDMLNP